MGVPVCGLCRNSKEDASYTILICYLVVTGGTFNRYERQFHRAFRTYKP